MFTNASPSEDHPHHSTAAAIGAPQQRKRWPGPPDLPARRSRLTVPKMWWGSRGKMVEWALAARSWAFGFHWNRT